MVEIVVESMIWKGKKPKTYSYNFYEAGIFFTSHIYETEWEGQAFDYSRQFTTA